VCNVYVSWMCACGLKLVTRTAKVYIGHVTSTSAQEIARDSHVVSSDAKGGET
jgi:hypothetical protein